MDNVDKFKSDVDHNRIVRLIEESYIRIFGKSVNAGERRSWNNSLKFMESILRNVNIPSDCGVLIEYNIPSTSKRIDFIISGYDTNNNANFVIIELKQWECSQATDKDSLVIAFVGGNDREMPHPSYQAQSYKQILVDMNESVYDNNINAYSCSYLHNYVKSSPEPLTLPQYVDLIEDTPIFFSNDTLKVQKYLYDYVGQGNGMDILCQIGNGKIKPSKKFVDCVKNMFDGLKVYTLLDEQKVAYENIIACAASKEKTTIIVNGGPGTGKSVVSMNAFVTLLNKDNNIRFVAPNASFRTALVESLVYEKKNTRKSIDFLFSGSGKFVKSLDNEFDVLVCDEAHRLKGKGAYMYMGENQIKDIIRSSKVNVFFIDDNQRIRPDDIGTVDEIKKIAKEFNSDVKEIELVAQFRCAGAEGFLNWVDHTLQIRDTANFDGWDFESFDFKVMDSPNDLHNLIKEKNSAGFKARMLAGYAWEWTPEKEGNYNGEINDVSLPEYEFSMPWNARNIQTKWAIKNEGIEQVGCVHTSQGLEFDYVGVIIGNDLRYNPDTMQLYSNYKEYFDKPGKKGLKDNPEELNKLIKNIYRVLMSRGMKGCYVFCRDKNLQEYIKSRCKQA